MPNPNGYGYPAAAIDMANAAPPVRPLPELIEDSNSFSLSTGRGRRTLRFRCSGAPTIVDFSYVTLELVLLHEAPTDGTQLSTTTGCEITAVWEY